MAGGVPPRWGLALIGNPAGYNHGAPMALLPLIPVHRVVIPRADGETPAHKR